MNKSKQKRSQFLTISTGTLGGAIIMLLLNMLLGDKAPWFVERLSASVKDIYSITLDVEYIFDKEHSIQDIDKNTYYVDHNSSFYLKEPPKDLWKIEFSNPGRILDDISFAYIPFMKISTDAFGKMFDIGEITRDDITTTTFKRLGSSYEITFTDSSGIEAIPLDFNPFHDLDFLKTSMRAGSSMFMLDESEIEKLLDETTEEGREFLERARYNMLQYGEKIIEENWPENQVFSEDVTITTFRKSLIERNIVYKLLYAETELLALPALSFLIFANPELFGNIKHIDVSNDNKVVLIDGSTSLKNLVINGNIVDKCELIRIYLVALTSDLIYVVRMQYLSGAGASRSVSKELETMFASFRVLF